MKTVKVESIQEVIDNPDAEYEWQYDEKRKHAYYIEDNSVFHLNTDINTGNLYRVIPDEPVREWFEIRGFMGKSGGYAPTKTKRYSAYLVTPKGEQRMERWQTGGRGYADPKCAIKEVEALADLLELEIVRTPVFKEVNGG